MTFINEFTNYCAICGGSIQGSNIDPTWLSQTVLLHSRTNFPDTNIQDFPANKIGGPYFGFLPISEVVTVCDKSGSIVPSPKPLYIACHQRCVSLTKRCVASQDAPSYRNVDESMRHLWLVLVNLFERASEDKIRPICNIYNAQAYGDIWKFQELVWEPSDDPETRFESEHFEADPQDVQDIASAILSHLQLVSQASINAFAIETSSLPLASKVDLECKLNYHPNVWRQALSEGYLPWLWDLEPAAIAQNEASKPLGHEWNWELVVRQLAQINLHEPKAIIGGSANGVTKSATYLEDYSRHAVGRSR